MENVNWGILGCGDVCERKSGPPMYKTPHSSLAAVMRRDAAKAADFARRHGVPRSYTDADALIADPGVDIVYVATPYARHPRFPASAPLFHFGPLDQGWWPDGLYTAPTDEALAYDVIKTKDFGYNMIRKHVKVEPARWYYHCDRLGLLVWQDMPSGDGGNKWEPDTYGGGTDRMRTPQSKAGYYREWREIMDHCMSNPCVVVWVPFNEAWGQFDTEAVAEWTKNYDPSRLVNPASGGNHRPCGDMADVHSYPTPRFKIFDMRRVMVLGEFGGIGLPLEEHLWVKNRNWGYIQFKTTEELTDEYVKYARMLENYVKCGFSGAVYTQTTDVEIEVNGLMTYDREVVKVDENRIREANRRVIAAMTEE